MLCPTAQAKGRRSSRASGEQVCFGALLFISCSLKSLLDLLLNFAGLLG